ncbi:hypothetical protein H5410_049299, partial [Solanum commersonii]
TYINEAWNTSHIDGFGYNEFQDDYKSLNTDSWKSIDGYPRESYQMFQWVHHYFDLANEKWERWRSPTVQKEQDDWDKPNLHPRTLNSAKDLTFSSHLVAPTWVTILRLPAM